MPLLFSLSLLTFSSLEVAYAAEGGVEGGSEGGVVGGVVGGLGSSGNAGVLGALAESVDLHACAASKPSLPGELEAAKKAVLGVRTPDGIGAAVIISAEGVALTAAHVVGEHKEVEVRSPSGLELTAKVLRVDRELDVAVLDLPGKGHPCLPVATARAQTGADLFAIGSPLGEALAWSVSKGVVSGYPTLEERAFLQTDTSINPGNSGGPLLSAGGEVLAIVSWKATGEAVEGVAFGIPVDRIEAAFAPDLSALVGRKGVQLGRPKVIFETAVEGLTIGVAHDMTTNAASAYGPISMTSTRVEDLCLAPCSRDLKPGVVSFVAYGDKYAAVRLKVDLENGQQRTFTADPQTSGERRLSAFFVGTGLLTAITGGSIWGTAALLASTGQASDDLNRAGVAATLGGAAVMVGGWGYGKATASSFTEVTTAE